MMQNKVKKIVVKGIDILLCDYQKSTVPDILEIELNRGDYAIIDSMVFNNEDVVIDIGGNIGSFSIYLAKKFPFLKIYAFEPVFENWRNFKRNLRLNNIQNVKAFHFAVSGKDNEFVKILSNPVFNGMSSMIEEISCNTGFDMVAKETVKTISLDKILQKNEISKVKLLKIDCEGAEFEIFYNSKMLNVIDYIVGETHSFDSKKNNREFLLNYLSKNFDKNRIQFTGW